MPTGCRLLVTALLLLTAAALHVAAFKPQPRSHPRHKLMTSADQLQRHVTGKCRRAASQWSGCSKSCGVGISTRVVVTPVPVLDAADPDAALASNEFEEGANGATEEGAGGCQVKREVRLCYLRPCDDLQRYQPARGRKCSRQKKGAKREHISYAKCQSVRSFRFRHCGLCHSENRCCTPKKSKTARVRFRCGGKKGFTKSVQMIRSCQCHHDCNAHYKNNKLPEEEQQPSYL